jgi:hypothetical protein
MDGINELEALCDYGAPLHVTYPLEAISLDYSAYPEVSKVSFREDENLRSFLFLHQDYLHKPLEFVADPVLSMLGIDFYIPRFSWCIMERKGGGTMLENGYVMQIDDRQYRILEQLGRGANSVAYLAECLHAGLTTKCILKEFSPTDTDDFSRKKERFLFSGKMQNDIRERSVLTNQTPPVSHIFEANGTAFIDVACFGGMTLDKLKDLTLPQYMAICRTIAKTRNKPYHGARCLLFLWLTNYCCHSTWTLRRRLCNGCQHGN